MQFFITTDGYLDQNGGEKGFPFSRNRFIALLKENINKPFVNQKEKLLNALDTYQSDEIRSDDVTVIGLKM